MKMTAHSTSFLRAYFPFHGSLLILVLFGAENVKGKVQLV